MQMLGIYTFCVFAGFFVFCVFAKILAKIIKNCLAEALFVIDYNSS